MFFENFDQIKKKNFLVIFKHFWHHWTALKKLCIKYLINKLHTKVSKMAFYLKKTVKFTCSRLFLSKESEIVKLK